MPLLAKDFKSFVYTIPPPGQYNPLPPLNLRPWRDLHSRIAVLQTAVLGYFTTWPLFKISNTSLSILLERN